MEENQTTPQPTPTQPLEPSAPTVSEPPAVPSPEPAQADPLTTPPNSVAPVTPAPGSVTPITPQTHEGPARPALSLDKLLNLVFVVGFASIFIANAIDAIENPAGFAKVIDNNIIAKHIGASELMVWIAIINDLILGALILTGWKKKYIYAWAGAWLILVAGMKLMNLVF